VVEGGPVSAQTDPPEGDPAEGSEEEADQVEAGALDADDRPSGREDRDGNPQPTP